MSNSTATSSINPNLLSALIAAVVAFIVLLLDKLFIEPRKWRNRYRLRTVEKVLEVHGSLVAILKSCHSRALMQNALPNAQYTVDRDDLRKLEAIFEEKSYLLGSKIQAEWETLHELEPRFSDLKDGKITELNLPLRAMREIAEKEVPRLSCTILQAHWTPLTPPRKDRCMRPLKFSSLGKSWQCWRWWRPR